MWQEDVSVDIEETQCQKDYKADSLRARGHAWVHTHTL